MSRIYLLGSGAVLVAVLVGSAAWGLGPARLDDSDVQDVWGGNPTPLTNNFCIGTDTCNCPSVTCYPLSWSARDVAGKKVITLAADHAKIHSSGSAPVTLRITKPCLQLIPLEVRW